MIREKPQLVIEEPVEFTNHFRGIYKIYPNLSHENGRMSMCNRLDLQIKQ